MAPISEISTASSASEGTVCSSPAAPSTSARSRRCGNTAHPQRHRDQHAMPTDTATSNRCWRASRARSAPNSLAAQPARGAVGHRAAGEARTGEEIARDDVEGHALQLGARVHGDHVAFVDAAFQRLQRGPGGRLPRRQVEPVQQHRVVAREVVAVVAQHAQAELADLGVGGVDVDHVDLAGGDRVVGQAVVQAGRRLREAVARCQALPAVGAADELVGQAEPQLGVARQVAQRARCPGGPASAARIASA